MANNRLNKKIGCLNIFLYFDVHLSQVCLVRIPTFSLFKSEGFMGAEVMANQAAEEVPQAHSLLILEAS